MSLYLFFAGVLLFCVLQFAYGSHFCLAIFFVPLLWSSLLLDKTSVKYRYVYFAFFIFWFVSIFWISAPHILAIFGLLILSGYLSLFGLFFFISARLAARILGFPLMVSAPLCWVGCEFLRNRLLGGFSFCSIEHLLFSEPLLIQVADIGGGYFVGGMIMSVGTGAGTILFMYILPKYFPQLCQNLILTNSDVLNNVTKNTSSDAESNLVTAYKPYPKYRKRFFVTIISTILLLTATIFYGYLTINLNCNPFGGVLGVDAGGGLKLNIAALQGNAPVSITMTRQELSDCLKQYIDLTYDAARDNNSGLDLIIWPETVCPIPYVVFQNEATYESQGWDRQQFDYGNKMLLNLSKEVKSPILYGISTTVVDNNRNKKSAADFLRLNSALLVTPNPSAFVARYDKIQLVMFGEYVPFADYLPENFPLRSICQEAGRGEFTVAMPVVDGVFAAVNICFESSVPHHVRGQILSLKKSGQEPALLINISNSGWFGFANQIDQHLATHIFRAVENRRPYVSATNGGFSTTINSYGQIKKIGKRKSAEPVIDQLEIKYWTPLYHYVGDIPAIICTIIMIFSVIVIVYKLRIAKNNV
ncbi:MAG: apolipoprotein N-acyltransferase [Planctomycetaceae bacterium]|jgi:apolipoprotein N-acyltransferase|nr:apolipoprotein N-acyltransferase [Planctomycetaceae bacterium]